MLSYKDATALFIYDKTVGKMFWKHNETCSVDIEEMNTATLVFLFHYGIMPFYTLMYKDNNPNNTKIENLVDVNPTGHGGTVKGKGFSRHINGLWSAYFDRAGIRINLGYHKTEIDAALARLTYECQCPLVTCYFVNPVVCWIAVTHPEINLKLIDGIIWPVTQFERYQ